MNKIQNIYCRLYKIKIKKKKERIPKNERDAGKPGHTHFLHHTSGFFILFHEIK